MAIIRLGCSVLTPLVVRWRLPNAIVIHPELLSVFGSNGLPASTSALRICKNNEESEVQLRSAAEGTKEREALAPHAERVEGKEALCAWSIPRNGGCMV